MVKFVGTAVIAAATLSPVASRSAVSPQHEAHQFLEFRDDQTNELRAGLAKAGADGFRVHRFARFPQSSAILLARGDGPPESYGLIATSRESTFLKELNAAGAGGSRLVPHVAKHVILRDVLGGNSSGHWIAVTAKADDGATYTYELLKGNDEEKNAALPAARKRGQVLAAVLGESGNFRGQSPKSLLILESRVVGGVVPTSLPEREYRVVGTATTGSLESEVRASAAEGFRAVAAGYMTVVMERDPSVPAAPVEYRLLAMKKTETAEQELNQAGAAGFRIAMTPQSMSEGVFLMHRDPANAPRVQFRLVKLKPETADEVLRGPLADGFHVAVLFGQVATLERME